MGVSSLLICSAWLRHQTCGFFACGLAVRPFSHLRLSYLRFQSLNFERQYQYHASDLPGPPASLRFVQTLDGHLRSLKQENGRTRSAGAERRVNGWGACRVRRHVVAFGDEAALVDDVLGVDRPGRPPVVSLCLAVVRRVWRRYGQSPNYESCFSWKFDSTSSKILELESRRKSQNVAVEPLVFPKVCANNYGFIEY